LITLRALLIFLKLRFHNITWFSLFALSDAQEVDCALEKRQKRKKKSLHGKIEVLQFSWLGTKFLRPQS
jgi:hypothetical protein